MGLAVTLYAAIGACVPLLGVSAFCETSEGAFIDATYSPGVHLDPLYVSCHRELFAR
jgi:hypothetical protein